MYFATKMKHKIKRAFLTIALLLSAEKLHDGRHALV